MRKLSHTKKPSRGEAFAMLLKMEPSRDVDSLLNYFAPAAPKTSRDSFEYCAKAVAADDRDDRTYLRYVYVENGDIVATNGHRMHYGKTDLANGFYCPKTRMPVDVDVKYPEWRRIIQRRERMNPAPQDVSTEVHLIGGKQVFAKRIGRACINSQYLDQAGANLADIFVDNDRNEVAGDAEHGSYVIHGIRL